MSKNLGLTKGEEKILQKLQDLETLWRIHGKKLWLYSASGKLHLMRGDDKGNPIMVRSGRSDGVSLDSSITTFDGIKNDGGDW